MITALCIDKLLPAAQYGGVPGSTQSEFDALRWTDVRPKPTWTQIVNIWPSIELSEYKRKKFNDVNFKIVTQMMFVKKIKKFDTLRDTFIDEYKKTHTSIAGIDASIALIEADLFEV